MSRALGRRVAARRRGAPAGRRRRSRWPPGGPAARAPAPGREGRRAPAPPRTPRPPCGPPSPRPRARGAPARGAAAATDSSAGSPSNGARSPASASRKCPCQKSARASARRARAATSRSPTTSPATTAARAAASASTSRPSSTSVLARPAAARARTRDASARAPRRNSAAAARQFAAIRQHLRQRHGGFGGPPVVAATLVGRQRRAPQPDDGGPPAAPAERGDARRPSPETRLFIRRRRARNLLVIGNDRAYAGADSRTRLAPVAPRASREQLEKPPWIAVGPSGKHPHVAGEAAADRTSPFARAARPESDRGRALRRLRPRRRRTTAARGRGRRTEPSRTSRPAASRAPPARSMRSACRPSSSGNDVGMPRRHAGVNRHEPPSSRLGCDGDEQRVHAGAARRAQANRPRRAGPDGVEHVDNPRERRARLQAHACRPEDGAGADQAGTGRSGLRLRLPRHARARRPARFVVGHQHQAPAAVAHTPRVAAAGRQTLRREEARRAREHRCPLAAPRRRRRRGDAAAPRSAGRRAARRSRSAATRCGCHRPASAARRSSHARCGARPDGRQHADLDRRARREVDQPLAAHQKPVGDRVRRAPARGGSDRRAFLPASASLPPWRRRRESARGVPASDRAPRRSPSRRDRPKTRGLRARRGRARASEGAETSYTIRA